MNDETLPDHLQPFQQQLQRRLAGWSVRLRAAKLEGMVGALLDAAEPLGPLGAQVLWFAQPALGLFVSADEIDGLASLLDDPAGVAWLRAELTGADRKSEGA
jgi:hypothetical protein